MGRKITIQGKKFAIPNHLQTTTKKWFKQVLEEYDFESHHVRLLTLAAEAWDRSVLAQAAIKKYGILYVDKGRPRPNPAIRIKEQAEIIFARLIRELNLDVEPPKPPGRPPGLY